MASSSWSRSIHRPCRARIRASPPCCWTAAVIEMQEPQTNFFLEAPAGWFRFALSASGARTRALISRTCLHSSIAWMRRLSWKATARSRLMSPTVAIALRWSMRRAWIRDCARRSQRPGACWRGYHLGRQRTDRLSAPAARQVNQISFRQFTLPKERDDGFDRAEIRSPLIRASWIASPLRHRLLGADGGLASARADARGRISSRGRSSARA